MVTYEDFKAKVVKMVETYYSRNCQNVEVGLTRVRKVNGLSLDGIVITLNEEGNNVAPTIYLKGYFRDYINGRAIEDIVQSIIDVNERNKIHHIDVKQFIDFDRVKDSIKCKIVNTAWNKELLEDIPHVEFLDMSIVFIAGFEQFPDGYVTVNNQHLKLWGIDKDELFEIAKRNSLKEQYFIKDMLSIITDFREECELASLLDGEDLEENVTDTFMYVMSNREKLFGANVILQEKYLERMSRVFRGNFYILPSSIHELITLPAFDESQEHIKELKKMVTEVNKSQVSIEERLSDNVYFYNATTKKITIA